MRSDRRHPKIREKGALLANLGMASEREFDRDYKGYCQRRDAKRLAKKGIGPTPMLTKGELDAITTPSTAGALACSTSTAEFLASLKKNVSATSQTGGGRGGGASGNAGGGGKAGAQPLRKLAGCSIMLESACEEQEMFGLLVEVPGVPEVRRKQVSAEQLAAEFIFISTGCLQRPPPSCVRRLSTSVIRLWCWAGCAGVRGKDFIAVANLTKVKQDQDPGSGRTNTCGGRIALSAMRPNHILDAGTRIVPVHVRCLTPRHPEQHSVLIPANGAGT